MTVVIPLAAVLVMLLLTSAAWWRYRSVAIASRRERGDESRFSLTARFGERHGFNAPHQEGVTWLWEVFSRSAKRFPDYPALEVPHTGERLTYAQLEDQSRRLAAWLEANGVAAGERVAFLAGNTTDTFEALFACAKLTAILVPLNWRLAVPELQFIVNDCRPQVLMYSDEFAAAAAELDTPVKLRLGDDYTAAKVSANPAAIGPVTATHDDPWAILYTSGTTGHPKGAICTHGMFFWNAINIGHAVGLTSKSTNLNVLPTFHSGGLNLYTTLALRLQ